MKGITLGVLGVLVVCSASLAQEDGHLSRWYGTVEVGSHWMYDYDYAKVFIWGSDSIFVAATATCYPFLEDNYRTSSFEVAGTTNLWVKGVCVLFEGPPPTEVAIITTPWQYMYGVLALEYDFYFDGDEGVDGVVTFTIPDMDTALHSLSWGSIKRIITGE